MTSQKNSDIHLRPRFKMTFNESQDDLIAKFSANLKNGDCKYCSKIVDGHIVIDVPMEENPKESLDILNKFLNEY